MRLAPAKPNEIGHLFILTDVEQVVGQLPINLFAYYSMIGCLRAGS